MNKNLNIEFPLPAGYEFDRFDTQTSTMVLKTKARKGIEYINTDDDVFADNGYTLSTFDAWCAGLDEDERATRFIKLLMKSLNAPDFKPDFDNTSQYKYEPRFLGGAVGFRFSYVDYWYEASTSGSRLCFDTEAKAKHAGTKFTRWFKTMIVVK